MGLQRGDFIEIIYMDERDNLSQRHVRVLSVNEHQFVAYCYLRKKIRCFSKSGLLAYSKKGHNLQRRTAI